MTKVRPSVSQSVYSVCLVMFLYGYVQKNNWRTLNRNYETTIGQNLNRICSYASLNLSRGQAFPHFADVVSFYIYTKGREKKSSQCNLITSFSGFSLSWKVLAVLSCFPVATVSFFIGFCLFFFLSSFHSRFLGTKMKKRFSFKFNAFLRPGVS